MPNLQDYADRYAGLKIASQTPTAMTTHAELDQRSLALHQAVAAKARREPARMLAVRQTLARRQAGASGHVQPYLSEWAALLAQGDDAALAVATEDSEREAALRQSSPFCGVLSDQERLAFLRAWRQSAAARTAR